jgi:hypothetical protein
MTIHNTNIAGFREKIAALGGDFARSYMFAIEIPQIGIQPDDKTTLTAFAQTMTLPQFELKSKNIEYQHINIKAVEGIRFDDDWTVTFWSDDSHILRSTFLTWSSLAWDFNRKSASTPKSYKRIANVYQLNRVGQPVCQYTMHGLFPRKVGGYELNNASNDLVSFGVNFTYDYYTINLFATNAKQEPSQASNKPNS